MAVKNVLFRITGDTTSVNKALNETEKEIADVEKQIAKTQKTTSGFSTALANAAGAFAGIAIGSAITAFGADSVKAAADFEKLSISFETFLGSAEAGKKTLKELQKFSAETPFTGLEVQEAGKSLLAFGVESQDLVNTLTRIGDVSSATGQNFNELANLFGIFKVQGTLYSQDINQLTQRGIPIIQEFADILGISTDQVKKLAAEGQITFDVFEKAFNNLTNQGGRFAGLTEKLSQSVAGRYSTLVDNVDQLKISIGTGLLPVAESLINAFSATVEAVRNLPTFIEENRTALSILAGAVTTYVASLAASNGISLIAIAREKALSIQYELSFIRLRLSTAAQKADTTAKRIGVVATEAATIATEGFNAVLKANPIGLVIGALTTLYLLFADFGDEVDETSKTMVGFVDASKAFDEFTKESSKNLSKETGALNALFASLRKAKTGSEERQKVIDEINSKYGVTLDNLSNEKKFVGQLDAAYKSILTTLKQKVLFEAQQDQLTKLYQEQDRLTKVLNKSLENREKIQKRINEEVANQDINPEVRLKAATSFEQAQIDAARSQLKRVEEAIKEIEKAYLDASSKLKPSDPESTIVDPKKVEATVKLLGDLRRELEQLRAEVEIKPIELINPDTVEESIDQLEVLRAAQKRQIDESIKNRKEDAKAAGTLTGTVSSQLDEIGRQKKILLDIDVNNKINQLRKEAAEKNAETIAAIDQKELERKLFETEEANKKIEELSNQLSERLSQATTKKAREAIKAEFKAKIEELIAGFKEEERIRIAQIEKQRDFDLDNTKLTEKERELIIKSADLEILKVKSDTIGKISEATKKGGEDESGADKKRREEIIEGAKAVSKELIGLLNAVSAARINEADQAISIQERRIERASELAEKGNAEILQLEEERLDKLNAIRADYVRQQQALALIEMVAQSSVAIAKAAAEGGAAAPFTIASTLIALAAGFIAAKSQAQAAGGFYKGGYTGDGGKYETAGTVHKGEFVFDQQKTRKFRPLFEAIHKGRDPRVAAGMSEKIIVIQNQGLDHKLGRIEKAIREQKGMSLSIDQRGIHGIVNEIEFKDRRIRNKAR